MFTKVILVSMCLAYANADWHGHLAGGLPAHQYPAGVSPSACPNYPYCDNPAVAAHPYAAGYGVYNHLGAGVVYGGAYAGDHSGAYAPHSAVESGQYTGDGDYHGEGLAESGAYGDVSQHYNGAYNGAYYGGHLAGVYAAGHHGHVHQLPAGVNPHTCPNYPFCH